ncbi:class II SORL domain-containing protein [candidate division WOR-3 bacterium]|nr:class II SORL domain-containing protein [candidate division WOR-3 bacterium]
MAEHIADNIQSADWKTEKHVPVIDCPNKVKPDEWVKVIVTLGKEIAHPNTTEHHIRWIKAFFVPDGAKFAYDLGTFEFNAHGESTEGPNKGPVYTHHEASFSFKTTKPGTINALSYCNIHGLWESSKKVDLS